MWLARFYSESWCEWLNVTIGMQDGERFFDDLQHMVKEQHQYLNEMNHELCLHNQPICLDFYLLWNK